MAEEIKLMNEATGKCPFSIARYYHLEISQVGREVDDIRDNVCRKLDVLI